jgi:hypothetical protein
VESIEEGNACALAINTIEEPASRRGEIGDRESDAIANNVSKAGKTV